MSQQIAFLGLGLIGGSFAAALQRAQAPFSLIGYDPQAGVADRAVALGYLDQAAPTPEEAVQHADIVIIAAPVRALASIFQQIAPALRAGTLVTDVASTKTDVVSWARDTLPANVAFLGGHPMAGREHSGLDAVDPLLFQHCLYCLTPTPETPPRYLEQMKALLTFLKVRLLVLEPQEHDRRVAAISHLPFLASSALMATVSEQPDWAEIAPLAATGFRDMSRLAAGDPTMYRDICLTNVDAIDQWLGSYITTLQHLRARIRDEDLDLWQFFNEMRQERQTWYRQFTEPEH